MDKLELIENMYGIFNEKVKNFRIDFKLDIEAVKKYAGKNIMIWTLRDSGTDIGFLARAAQIGSWENATIPYNDTAYIIAKDLKLIPIEYQKLIDLSKSPDALRDFIKRLETSHGMDMVNYG